MSIVVIVLIYVGVFLGLRRLLRDIFSTYTRICITLLLAPAFVLLVDWLAESLVRSGVGDADLSLLVWFWIGVPLVPIALVGLFIGAVVGWVRLGVQTATGQTSAFEPADAVRCSTCGHPLSEHALSVTEPVFVLCSHAECECMTPSRLTAV